MWASPWVRAAPPRPRKPPTWSSWSTGSIALPTPSRWRRTRAPSRSRASSAAWRCPYWGWLRPPSDICRPLPAPWRRSSSTSPSCSMRCGPCGQPRARTWSLPVRAPGHPHPHTPIDLHQSDRPPGRLSSRASEKKEVAMKALDIMTQPVTSVASDTSVLEAVRIMLQKKISGLPVVDAAGALVGMVSEGDLLRRVETGTQRRRPRWIEFLLGPGRLAEEYVRAGGRTVNDVMTSDVHTATEETPLEEIVRLMERHGIKRVPVLRGRHLVGIVTRANVIRALVTAAVNAPTVSTHDAAIRDRLIAALKAQPWAPVCNIHIGVCAGVVTLSGVISDERQRPALCVAAGNIPGVKKVEDRLAWIIPGTGLAGEPPLVIEATQH